MTRAEVSTIRIFGKDVFRGRPFKPLAVGLIIAGFTLAVNSLHPAFSLNAGPSDIPQPADPSLSWSVLLMGLFAATGLILMVFAWIVRKQKMYEIGLLLSMAAWISRSVALGLDGHPWYATFPLSMAVMAAGAYWLEQLDTEDSVR